MMRCVSTLVLLSLVTIGLSFSSTRPSSASWSRPRRATRTVVSAIPDGSAPARRAFLVGCLSSLGAFAVALPSNAIPMVTADEFNIILRDSSRSITRVEFSGPKSETVTVRLVDGTAFGIKDIVESSTDPRSPLKIAAACRESGVPSKFVELEAVLANAPKKKKLYTNQRVAEANEKEKERLARIAQDEENRLAELYRMEVAEAERLASSKK
ncbi:predicted protein [Phaeodactylum tricornutum CCAP 1055/1]|uniref:Uncharacterized protein n=1 Tax=Phaeodactylum tricornutum (strain CCAP 1055/1) TaxID=556484 RepID=B7FVK0_PHATC|nr:predicted protein [Phaeodactylum tricornutum CCAP 1055/1]EEC49417.1 predicted protein [Phaeodactylum tricornutum CCAP 1055/1]|eukprot:XP_002178719.1 predicted protein [Phaeodactylum tricornutum CCAP 1055/1]